MLNNSNGGMKMKKVESLKKLLEIVSAEGFQLANGSYFEAVTNHEDLFTGECRNCAVGHLLKIVDVDDLTLCKMDKGSYGPNGNYSISAIVRDKDVHPDTVLAEAFEKLGFNISKDDDINLLKDIQNANDNYGKIEVMRRLEYMISKLENISKLEKLDAEVASL
jgi:hypothetical protein